MKDIMIDLETLGTRSDALILSIGACYFDRETGVTGEEFSTAIETNRFIDQFTVDYDTISWWMNQPREAQYYATAFSAEFQAALAALRVFLDKPDVNLWSHATFDIPILTHAFEVAGIKLPVPFRNMRDIRTVMELVPSNAAITRNGVHHHALDDAKYQAQYVADALKRLKHGG